MRTDPKAVLSLVPREPGASPDGAAPEPGPGSVREPGALPGRGEAAGVSPPGAAASDARHEEPSSARLEALRAMVENGEYPVDLDLLATRIVEDEKARSGGS